MKIKNLIEMDYDNIIKETGTDPKKVKQYFEQVIAPSFWGHILLVNGHKVPMPYWR